MKKTVELDDAEDLIESELEIFDRESRGASSLQTEHDVHDQLIPPDTAGSLVVIRSRGLSGGSLGGDLKIRDTLMMSKKTQTDPDEVKPLPPITRKTTSSNLLHVVSNTNNVRTLTRQLKTGTRSTMSRTMSSKRFKPPVADDDDEEDEEDEFANLEAGASKSRLNTSIRGNTGLSSSMSSRFKQSFRSIKRQVTKPVLDIAGIGRTVNKRAKLSYIQLKIHDLKVAFERQRNERNEFWVFKKDIKAIQGELGSSTAALFLFVRYILMINLFSSFFWFFLVALPQAINFDYTADKEVFVTLHLFLGTGRVASSWLFFSGYEEEFKGYKMYLAYLLVHFVSIGGVFIGILKTIANDFIREGSSFRDQQNSLALNLFSSWDFSINSKGAIKEQMKSLESNFKDQICELTSLKKERTVKERRIMYSLRVLAWFIWVLLIAGAIAGIVATIKWSNEQDGEGFLSVYGPTLALTAINSAVPFFMQQLTLLEQYDNGRQEQYITIFRVYIMRMISLLTFIITLIRDSSDSPGECMQLYWGQEFYKLCIINTFSNVGSLLKYAAFSYLMGTKKEVDLPSSLMALIYFQGCIWFGNLFCPLLSMIASVSNIIYFMVGAAIVKKCCQPPTKRYNARNGKFFNSFLAVTVLIMIVVTCYVILQTSVQCGPYANPKFGVIWDSFSVWKDGWDNELVDNIVTTVLSGPVVVAAMFVLVVVIYFLQINNQKKKVRDRILMEEIRILQKEKAELMKEKLKKNSVST